MALAERCCHSIEDATYHQHFQDKMILVGRFQSVILYNIKREETSLRQEAMQVCCHGVISGTVLRAEAPSTRAEVPGHLSCWSQPSLTTKIINQSTSSSTATALRLGMVFSKYR